MTKLLCRLRGHRWAVVGNLDMTAPPGRVPHVVWECDRCRNMRVRYLGEQP